jgi:hypothetical protein
LIGSDRDAGAIEAARANAERAGVGRHVEFFVAPLSDVTPPAPRGLLITNPPYGVRVGDSATLRNLYAKLGVVARTAFAGWRFAMLSADRTRGHVLERQLGMRLTSVWQSTNGGIPVRLLMRRREDEKTRRRENEKTRRREDEMLRVTRSASRWAGASRLPVFSSSAVLELESERQIHVIVCECPRCVGRTHLTVFEAKHERARWSPVHVSRRHGVLEPGRRGQVGVIRVIDPGSHAERERPTLVEVELRPPTARTNDSPVESKQLTDAAAAE